MELHLKIIGVLMILLSSIHVVFPSYFNWNEDLKNISLINRQMMWVHTFFIAIVVLLMGMLCICSTNAIIQTSLGRTIALGFCIFWIVRFFIQHIGYSPSLWIGKKFETAVHVSFSLLWAYFSFVFLSIYLSA